MRAARARLRRLDTEQAAAAVRHGAVLVDVRSGIHRERDGVIPGALHYRRNVLEWRMDPESGHSDPAVGGLDRQVDDDEGGND